MVQLMVRGVKFRGSHESFDEPDFPINWYLSDHLRNLNVRSSQSVDSNHLTGAVQWGSVGKEGFGSGRDIEDFEGDGVERKGMTKTRRSMSDSNINNKYKHHL